MYTRLRPCIIALVSGSVAACGSNLVLPDDGAPAALHAVSGDGQEGMISSQLSSPLVVRVTDARSLPLAGVPVIFRFKTEVPAAQVTPTEAETDSDGRASAEVRLGTDVGEQVVEAQVAEASAAELRATFELTATAPENEKPGKGGRNGHDEDEEDDD